VGESKEALLQLEQKTMYERRISIAFASNSRKFIEQTSDTEVEAGVGGIRMVLLGEIDRSRPKQIRTSGTMHNNSDACPAHFYL